MQSQTKLRFSIAFLIAMLVTAACLNVTFESGSRYIGYSQLFTEKALKRTGEAIDAYRRQNGKLPSSLKEIEAVLTSHVMVQEGGVVWDIWRHPLKYTRHGDDYNLVSYGQDGKPGGVGLDFDLALRQPRTPESWPTFSQVILAPVNQRMVLMTILSGLMTFGLTFWLVRPGDLSTERIISLVVKMLVMLVATVIAAITITGLHVPSGH
ncbi:hypothetical protein EON80_10035 [bacterium]|nr:MAG: hypothetical protein EON80_10035 [bacterium]